MKMNQKLTKYYLRANRKWWFYSHLIQDPDFKTEVTKLEDIIIIKQRDGTSYNPVMIEDFDYLNDPNKDRKLKLINDFCIKWNIDWPNQLLFYLMPGREAMFPPKTVMSVVFSYDEHTNILNVQMPLDIEREELDILWSMILAERERRGIDITKKPRKSTFNKKDSAIAFNMWKMRRDGIKWAEVTKYLNDCRNKSLYCDITSAQRFLKANGYFL